MLLLMAPGQPCASSSPDFDTHLRSVDTKASGGGGGVLAGRGWQVSPGLGRRQPGEELGPCDLALFP